jgi:hypothetical protein
VKTEIFILIASIFSSLNVISIFSVSSRSVLSLSEIFLLLILDKKVKTEKKEWVGLPQVRLG